MLWPPSKTGRMLRQGQLRRSRIGCHSRVWLLQAAAGIVHSQQQPGLAQLQLWGLVHGTSTCTGRQHGQEEGEVLCS